MQYILVCNILTVKLHFSLSSSHLYPAIFFFISDRLWETQHMSWKQLYFCSWELFLKSGSHILVHSSLLVTWVLLSGEMTGRLTPPSREILISLPQQYQQLCFPLSATSLHGKNFFIKLHQTAMSLIICFVKTEAWLVFASAPKGGGGEGVQRSIKQINSETKSEIHMHPLETNLFTNCWENYSACSHSVLPGKAARYAQVHFPHFFFKQHVCGNRYLKNKQNKKVLHLIFFPW